MTVAGHPLEQLHAASTGEDVQQERAGEFSPGHGQDDDCQSGQRTDEVGSREHQNDMDRHAGGDTSR